MNAIDVEDGARTCMTVIPEERSVCTCEKDKKDLTKFCLEDEDRGFCKDICQSRGQSWCYKSKEFEFYKCTYCKEKKDNQGGE